MFEYVSLAEGKKPSSNILSQEYAVLLFWGDGLLARQIRASSRLPSISRRLTGTISDSDPKISGAHDSPVVFAWLDIEIDIGDPSVTVRAGGS
jgi:hypothetical protein